MTLFDTLTKAAFDVAETGFQVAETVLKRAQTTVDTLVGVDRKPFTGAPVSGPPDLDNAVSDLANRAARIAYFTPMNPAAIPGAMQNLAGAAKAAFQNVDWRDPKTLALPLRLPLSVGTLLTDSGFRGLMTMEVIGAPRYLEFLKYSLQIFSEFPVYSTLEYRDLMRAQEKWLEGHPDDAVTRTELGRALVKVGNFREAAAQLERAAEGSAGNTRSTALHEAGLAAYNSGDYAKAVRLGCQALEANPENAPARMWVWLAAQKLGGYPEEVAESFRMEVKPGWDPTALQYEDISVRIGLDKTAGARGIVVIDYNNDGLPDVAIGAAHGGISLYRNNGDGTFADVSIESGLFDCTNVFGMSSGDYNNDGFPDILVCRLGFFGGMVELWRNNGDGTFTDVSNESGISCWGPCFSCSFVDYDNDGKLDIFVCTNLGGLFDRFIQNKLFHNNGDGTFTEVAEKAGIVTRWPSIGHSWGDYNNDGYPDLFLSHAIGPPQLFRNNGNGTFTDVTVEAGLDSPTLAFGSQWCDIDDDGWLDIIQYTWAIHEDVIHSLRHGEAPPEGYPTAVYRNNRNGTFTNINRELGVNQCWGSMSGNVADINNDGYPDIVLGNGGPLMDRIEPLVILENDGTKFHNVTFSAGLPFMGKGHGINCADLFGDGRLSILIATGGAYPGDLMTSSVFCPKERLGNYLAVKLYGTKSNRDAYGARLKLVAGGREQHRVLNGGSNFGCLPLQQHFGLGKLTKAESLEIWWPSGLRQRFENLSANQLVKITEGEELITG